MQESLCSPSRSFLLLRLRQLQKRPCEEEKDLFAACLTRGESCSEFEEKYFQCLESK